MNGQFYTLLCIDAVENDLAAGRFYTENLAREEAFAGLDRFFLAIDAIMEENRGNGSCAELRHCGTLATFKIRIIFRRNQSWQGSVLWLETRHEENFRSALELMTILSQAIELAKSRKMCPSGLKVMK